jgi:hypothetical protein
MRLKMLAFASGRLLFLLLDVLAFVAYGVLLAYSRLRRRHDH